MKSLTWLLLGLFLAGRLAAHEFWLWPETFSATPGATVRVGLRVGENFTGEVRPFSAARAAALQHISAAGTRDLLALVPAAPGVDSLSVVLATAGTHLLAYDSQPSTITLPPDKFLAYLKENGLQEIAALRHAAGQDQLPGRERYRRFVKTLLLAGPRSDATYAVRTGQRLEIVPVTDPLAAQAGDRISFIVLFNGQPLAGALVQAWHHDGARLVEFKAQSDSTSTVTFEFSSAGPWMISVVHMVPLKDVSGLDWESSWSSLTFERP
jgi:uncharacterized GH25 family protein